MLLHHPSTVTVIALVLLSSVQISVARRWHGFLGSPSKVPALQSLTSDIADLWFEQPLDHFNVTDSRTWQQRYFVNSAYYRPDANSPIFVMIGGEGEAAKHWMTEGAWIHYAQLFSAYCIQVEHRYYGKSRPTSDLSVDNLKYLTSEQALADLAHFIRTKKRDFNATQKWIVFGGSYPGSLAAWMRRLYPDLVDGGISSSGPLLAQVNFKEYFEVVEASLATYEATCVDAVRRSFDQVDILTRHMIGQRSLDEKFKTCTPIKESIEDHLDMANFYENLAGNFAGVVQYNKDNSNNSKVTIDEVCDIMANVSIGAPVMRLAAVNALMLRINNQTCLDYKYAKMIEDMRSIDWESESAKGMRQWTYQTCNEFGFYQTAQNQSEAFGNHFDVEFFIRQCMDIFSMHMNADYLQSAVSQTNLKYGALQPNTTNVLYVHGTIDPWHALGLTTSRNRNLPTILIKGTAHCANMYESRGEQEGPRHRRRPRRASQGQDHQRRLQGRRVRGEEIHLLLVLA